MLELGVVYLIIFILEIFILFLLSKKFTKRIITFLFRLTKSKKWTSYIYAFIFFPGTFVHEMSHFLTALVLFVPIGKINLFPDLEEGGNGDQLKIRLGSVLIAKSGVVRGFFVGIAPFMLGMLIILLSTNFIILNEKYNIYLRLLVGSILIFEVGNTMFLSKSDLKNTLGFIIILVLFFILFYLMGFRLSYQEIDSYFTLNIISAIKTSNYFLMIPIIIDCVGLFILKGVR